MKTTMRILAVLAFAFSAEALAQVKFRVPLSMLSTQCANGRCYPTAYFDTNRSGSYYRDWACKTKTYNQHDGVDYGIGGFAAMDQGRWVMSAAAGKVIAVHDGEYDRCTSGNCGVGNYVKLQHADGKISVYWHLKKWSITVKLGQWVPCGVYLGKVGSSGYSTGPHLHFGVVVPGFGADDPYAAVNSNCGGTFSFWTQQGPYGGLPGMTCQ